MPDSSLRGNQQFMLLHRCSADICGGAVSSLLDCHRPATWSPCSHSPQPRGPGVAPPHASSQERPPMPVCGTSTHEHVCRATMFFVLSLIAESTSPWYTPVSWSRGDSIRTLYRKPLFGRCNALSPPLLLLIPLSSVPWTPRRCRLTLCSHSTTFLGPLSHLNTPRHFQLLPYLSILVRRPYFTCLVHTSPLPPGPICPHLPQQLAFWQCPFHS